MLADMQHLRALRLQRIAEVTSELGNDHTRWHSDESAGSRGSSDPAKADAPGKTFHKQCMLLNPAIHSYLLKRCEHLEARGKAAGSGAHLP